MEKLGQGAAEAAIETIPSPIPPGEKQSEGIGWCGYGIGIIILGVVGFGLYKNYQTNKK